MRDVGGGSIYSALAARGMTVHHGVATITPNAATGTVARRLGVPRGSLLLTLFQVDSTADGVVVLVSEEHHLADAFEISVYRRGPGDGEEGVMATELVVGVDVGSQGTCAQAIARTGRTAPPATCRTRSPTRARAGPSRSRASGWAPSPRRWPRCRRAVDGSAIRAISFGSQLDGLVPAAADGEPTGPALIWMDRRAGAECDAAADRIRPERLREITGCNLDPGHVAAKIAWLAGNRPRRSTRPPAGSCCRARSSPGTPPASWPSIRPTPRRRCCSTFAAATGRRRRATAFGIDPGSLAPVRPAHHALGPVAPWLREAAGLDPGTQVVLGCGDEMAATLGAGVVEPGVVCDVMGTAEPVCAVSPTRRRSTTRA